jgi:hypothetical protein
MRKQQADRKDEERREKAWSELNKQFDFQHQSTLEDHSL